MIHRGAEEGQTDSHIDAIVKTEELDWDMALVMIHDDNDVKFFAAYRAEENGVRWNGASCSNSFLLRRFYSRDNFIDIFAAE